MTPKILHINNYPGNSGADLAFRTTVDLLKQYTDFTNWTAYVGEAGDPDFAFHSWEDRQGTGKLSYIYSSINRNRLSTFLQERRPDIVHAHGFYSAISPSILGAIGEGQHQWNMKFVHTAHSHELICPNASAFCYTKNRICTDCKGHHPKLKIFYRNCDRRGWIYSWVKGVRYLVAQTIFQQAAMTDKIICPSKLMMNNLLDEGIAGSKLALVRTPLEMQRYQPGPDRRREIVYFGRFSREKNIAQLIDAFRAFVDQHPDWKLILIGDGPERENLKANIESAGLGDAVEMLPFLDQPALFERISKSRIMVMMSSVLENWPLVIPEAVMCGLYPVVPGHGGMKEAVDWLGVGLCYESDSTGSLAGALSQARQQAKDTATIESTQIMIQRELGPQRYVELIGGIYQGLLGEPV